MQNAQLDCLHFEDQLVPSPPPPFLGEVDGPLLEEAKLARKITTTVLKAFKTGGAETIKNSLRQKEKALLTVDKNFRVEIEWMRQMCGEAGEALLRHQLMPPFPTAEMHVSVAVCLGQVTQVSQSPLVGFVDIAASGEAHSAVEIAPLDEESQDRILADCFLDLKVRVDSTVQDAR